MSVPYQSLKVELERHPFFKECTSGTRSGEFDKIADRINAEISRILTINSSVAGKIQPKDKKNKKFIIGKTLHRVWGGEVQNAHEATWKALAVFLLGENTTWEEVENYPQKLETQNQSYSQEIITSTPLLTTLIPSHIYGVYIAYYCTADLTADDKVKPALLWLKEDGTFEWFNIRANKSCKGEYCLKYNRTRLFIQSYDDENYFHIDVYLSPHYTKKEVTFLFGLRSSQTDNTLKVHVYTLFIRQPNFTKEYIDIVKKNNEIIKYLYRPENKETDQNEVEKKRTIESMVDVFFEKFTEEVIENTKPTAPTSEIDEKRGYGIFDIIFSTKKKKIQEEIFLSFSEEELKERLLMRKILPQK